MASTKTNKRTKWRPLLKSNFLRPSTLLLCKTIICQCKNIEKASLSFFIGDFRHQIFLFSMLNLCVQGKIWWHKPSIKNDKVDFSVFFHLQIIFLHKSKVDGLKKFVYYMALFFWFDTFEGMSFFQQYFLAKGGTLGFRWTLFLIHFLP